MIVFVYKLDSVVQVLDLEQSKLQHSNLINEDWKHIATLDACLWIAANYKD
jgi:hypothetical protein